MRKLLTVVMDGVGYRTEKFGNAVSAAKTPNLDWLKANALYTTIRAHGTAVGLPSDSDIGNSEVGHNALGAGVIHDQGAKLVNNAIADGSLFQGKTWQTAIAKVKNTENSLHFLGLLSDGNVHSHEKHLFALIQQAHAEGIKKIRIHALLDGRDVPAQSAEIYLKRLSKVLAIVNQQGCDAKVASGGGRMQITMDRYGADWDMVKRGWDTHVRGKGPRFPSIEAALENARKDPKLGDQYIPEFVIEDQGQAVGTIQDGDSIINFNFRGDRAIEISQAFEDKDFDHFKREIFPEVFYAGMMEYDGDAHIPSHYLVTPPLFSNTMGERLASMGIKQFACSETQKFGHVTFFWNGNRSGYFDKKLEHYVEIPSDNIEFNQKPRMKAIEITQATIKEMQQADFQFGRINYANGDMVGHTGDFDAAVIAITTVDEMIGQLILAAQKTDTILIITADHGNADEMFEGKEADYPDWQHASPEERPKGKTSHTLAEVPFFVYDPKGEKSQKLAKPSEGTLANVANTAIELMGLKTIDDFNRSLIRE